MTICSSYPERGQRRLGSVAARRERPGRARPVVRLRQFAPCVLLCWACDGAASKSDIWATNGGRHGASPSWSNARGGSGSGGNAGAAPDAGAPGAAGSVGGELGDAYPEPDVVLASLRRANDYFMTEWPDPGAWVDFSLESHVWTRAVYYEGLMALYRIDRNVAYYDYAVRWGESHSWGLRRGATGVFADDQCAGQTYIDLYAIEPLPERINDIRISLDTMLASKVVSNWYWIDAIQMSMPVFAKFGALTNDTRYFDKMAALYEYTRNSAGDSSGEIGAGGPLYDTGEHLWWRDKDFDPPYRTQNGKPCYWSRGNGWVFAGLARVLEVLPSSDPHRALYQRDFQDMAYALKAAQRDDGFWNVNLGDPDDYGGPELTGTSLFTYGFAWGVRSGTLSDAEFRGAIVSGWRAMESALHPDGFLGYVQSTGKQPSDGQPVTFDAAPNLDDFGLGCFLLGGSEVARLAARQ